MKTYFNLRSTIGNSSWPQRGLAALATLAVAAVVGITLIQALRPVVHAVPTAPAAQGANPAMPNPNVPISGAGSAHDGSAYVEYLLSGPSAEPVEPALANSNVPVPQVDSSYSGSAYAEYLEYLTGRPFSELARPAAQAQPTGLGIDLPAGTDLRGMPAGLTDYVRRNPSAARSLPDQPVIGTGSAYAGGAYEAARRASVLTRVPYEAGWQLYDNGWAGGPRTAPQS
jgi:hypothetical protein